MCLLSESADVLRTQVTKLLCKATESPPDSPAHFLFVGLVGVAITTDPAHSQYWLRPALSLLQFVRDNITSLAEV